MHRVGRTYIRLHQRPSGGRQVHETTHEICEYVGRTYKFGADTKMALQTLKKPVFQDPPDPPPGATRTQIRKWEKHVDELVKRETSLESNLMSAYSVIYGQCSDVMRAKLESRPDFDTIESTSDSLSLLETSGQ
jgi:hypothetical protein